MAAPVRVSELQDALDDPAQPPRKRLRSVRSCKAGCSRVCVSAWSTQCDQPAPPWPEDAPSSTLWGEPLPPDRKFSPVLRGRAAQPSASTPPGVAPPSLHARPAPPPPPAFPRPAWLFRDAPEPPAAPTPPPDNARATLYARLQARREARRQLRAEQAQQETSRVRAVQHTIDHLEQLEAAWEATQTARHPANMRRAVPSPPAWRLPSGPARGARPATPPAHAPASRWAGDRLADAFLSLLQAMPDAHNLERDEGAVHALPWAPGLGGHVSAVHRLPLQLLLTDRDFDEDDYELLLALDETVENRKGLKRQSTRSFLTHARTGASKEEIAALPTRMLDEEQLGRCSEPRCPICLEAHEVGASLRELPCGHAWHVGCVDTWLQHKSTCPVCTQDICRKEIE